MHHQAPMFFPARQDQEPAFPQVSGNIDASEKIVDYETVSLSEAVVKIPRAEQMDCYLAPVEPQSVHGVCQQVQALAVNQLAYVDEGVASL